MLLPTLLLWILLHKCKCSQEQKFPPWFKFGASSSSYQIEGAWNVSDKTESRWDHLIHSSPHIIKDGTNGDVACDSYHYWERDVEMASQLGLQFYKYMTLSLSRRRPRWFSINWPRLLPNGFPSTISEDGKRYYNNLIDGLLKKNIEPVVTLHHFELPQILQDFGGWTNPLMSDWYADYSRVVFTLFGDRVKTWMTINEPQMECDMIQDLTSRTGLKIPLQEDNIAAYLCNKYILLGHAKAWRIYDEEFRHLYNGKISISNHLLWVTPSSPQDAELTEITRQFLSGRYSHPIYSKAGGWPPIVEEVIGNVSGELGYYRTRLPPFSVEEIELIRGTYDFYGMNHYTSRLVRPARPNENYDNFMFSSVPEIKAVFDVQPEWRYGYSKILPIYPEGIRQQMLWLQKQYGDIEILITENGYSSKGSKLKDDERVAFIKGYLEQVLMAIHEGVNVTGYSYWSLMDNFEWLEGYTSKFGLYEVDFTDVSRRRTPRKSAKYYSKIVKSRYLSNDIMNSLENYKNKI